MPPQKKSPGSRSYKTAERRYETPAPGTIIGGWEFLSELSGYVSRCWECRCLGCNRIHLQFANAIIKQKSKRCIFCHNSAPRVRCGYSAFKTTEQRFHWSARHKAMIARCYNPKHHAFKNYGGRGIAVSDELRNPKTFSEFIVSLPGWDDPALSMDRIDNNGNYERGNIRMATDLQQANNTRRTGGVR